MAETTPEKRLADVQATLRAAKVTVAHDAKATGRMDPENAVRIANLEFVVQKLEGRVRLARSLEQIRELTVTAR